MFACRKRRASCACCALSTRAMRFPRCQLGHSLAGAGETKKTLPDNVPAGCKLQVMWRLLIEPRVHSSCHPLKLYRLPLHVCQVSSRNGTCKLCAKRTIHCISDSASQCFPVCCLTRCANLHQVVGNISMTCPTMCRYRHGGVEMQRSPYIMPDFVRFQKVPLLGSALGAPVGAKHNLEVSFPLYPKAAAAALCADVYHPP